MDTNACLPAMGAHARLAQWIETHETLLTSVLLSRPRGGTRLCGLLLSEDGDDCLLRRCEGSDDAWMLWTEQRRVRSKFGHAYAEALASDWLERLEADGWRVIWQARREPAPARVAVAA